MKKSIIVLIGLLTLVACSEDAYQETDKMNDNGAVENTEPQNSTMSFDPAIGYDSPFNGFALPEVIDYVVVNDFPHPVELIGHFGLAYYDGADDGIHFSYNLITGVNPNIYFGGNEYGNQVHSAAVPVPPMTTMSFLDGRCPVRNIGVPSFPVDSSFGGQGQGAEETIINQAGKVYYFNIGIPAVGFGDRFKIKCGNDAMDFATLSSLSSDWTHIGPFAAGPGDLVHNNITGEICLIADSSGVGMPSEASFTYAGQTWYVRVFTDNSTVRVTITL